MNNTKGIISKHSDPLCTAHNKRSLLRCGGKCFRFDSKAKKNLMRSIKNDFASKRKYSEVFISFGDKDFKVLRLELSPEKFLAFQTDGSIWQELQDRAKSTDILTAIQTMLS